MTVWIATGYAYDPATRDWTLKTEYRAMSEVEAARWCNFNRNWMKNLSRRAVMESATPNAANWAPALPGFED